MTSNIGLHELSRQAAIGFNSSGANKEISKQKYEEMKDSVIAELKKHFRPELLNRLDKTIVFKPLDKASIAKTLSELPENSTVIIDGEKSFYISDDVLENIQEFIENAAPIKNIKVITKGIKEFIKISRDEQKEFVHLSGF